MLKQFLSIIAVLFITSISAHAAQPAAPSKTIPAPVIAIIDVQRILEESLASKSVQQQLESHRAKVQAEVAGEETKLRAAEKELVESRNIAPPDVYAEKEQQLRQRLMVVEKQVQSRRKALDQAFMDSMGVVKKTLQDLVKTLAEERGANMVILKQQAFWSDKSMELTDEALSRLNKALPKVDVKILTLEDLNKQSEGSQPSLLKKQAQ